MDREFILTEIRRCAESKGAPPGRKAFRTETGIKESDWCGRYWARWSDAVREAGYPPNRKQEPLPTDLLIEKLVGLIRELGHFPVMSEVRLKANNDPGFPSHNTISRLGPKQQAALRVIAYCESRQGLDDVLLVCRPLVTPSDPADAGPERGAGAFGFVYLLRSGQYYKIGKTNAAGRRERELAIQLPEKGNTVHVIRTDDPTGIESYWHNRFAGKRKNGEWFALTAADIASFRRRKFM